MDWRLWFIQLSGWPAFLVIVLVVVAASGGLSVVMTKMGNRSIVQNAVLAVLFVAAVGLGLVGVLAVLSRWNLSR